MHKYLLTLWKTSCFLIFLSSAMSFGSNRAPSKVEASWHPTPLLKSLSDSSSFRGVGSQARGSGGWLSPLSTPLCEVWMVLYYFAALWVSSSWAGRDLPASTTSFPFYSLFFFWSVGSGLGGRNGWGGGRGDFWGGGGSFGCANFPGAPFPGWDSINYIKLLWDFLWIPISSEVMTSAWC